MCYADLHSKTESKEENKKQKSYLHRYAYSISLYNTVFMVRNEIKYSPWSCNMTIKIVKSFLPIIWTCSILDVWVSTLRINIIKRKPVYIFNIIVINFNADFSFIRIMNFVYSLDVFFFFFLCLFLFWILCLTDESRDYWGTQTQAKETKNKKFSAIWEREQQQILLSREQHFHQPSIFYQMKYLHLKLSTIMILCVLDLIQKFLVQKNYL